jgi:hypothetical protein
MKYHLVVVRRFLNYVRGDIISDAAKIAEIQSTEHRKFVMKVALPPTTKG